MRGIERKSRVPSVWTSGFNAGVLFMRLDRLREFNYEKKILNIVLDRKYNSKFDFAEQDLLNILFHKNTGL